MVHLLILVKTSKLAIIYGNICQNESDSHIFLMNQYYINEKINILTY